MNYRDRLIEGLSGTESALRGTGRTTRMLEKAVTVACGTGVPVKVVFYAPEHVRMASLFIENRCPSLVAGLHPTDGRVRFTGSGGRLDLVCRHHNCSTVGEPTSMRTFEDHYVFYMRAIAAIRAMECHE